MNITVYRVNGLVDGNLLNYDDESREGLAPNYAWDLLKDLGVHSDAAIWLAESDDYCDVRLPGGRGQLTVEVVNSYNDY